MKKRLLAALLLLSVASGCAQPSEEPEPEPDAGWQALPESPLSPRTDAQAFWTGSSVLVIGGSDDVTCPPFADCVDREPPLKDGAAYDLETGTWTELPDAPVPMGYVSGAVVEGTLYAWVPSFDVPSAFLSYAPGDPDWVEHPQPPFDADSSMALVAAGDRVIAYQTTQEVAVQPDLIYDPEADSWTELPLDPLTPAFDRQMVWTDGRLVLLAHELVAQPNSERPSIVEAARLDLEGGTWQRYPDSEILGGPWRWTGDRLVNPTLGGADGGEVNGWGRVYPYGGIFEPTRGEWSELPNTPDAQGDFHGFSAAGGGWAISTDGWAFHAPSSTWVDLPRPAAGAAEMGQAATWAGDRLFVFGGSRITNERLVLIGGGWTWIPRGGS